VNKLSSVKLITNLLQEEIKLTKVPELVSVDVFAKYCEKKIVKQLITIGSQSLIIILTNQEDVLDLHQS
jgi:hypothetical protein